MPRVEYVVYVSPVRYATIPDFNRSFFEDTANALSTLLPDDEPYARYVKVIDVRAATGGWLLEVVMNAEEEKAVGYIRTY